MIRMLIESSSLSFFSMKIWFILDYSPFESTHHPYHHSENNQHHRHCFVFIFFSLCFFLSLLEIEIVLALDIIIYIHHPFIHSFIRYKTNWISFMMKHQFDSDWFGTCRYHFNLISFSFFAMLWYAFTFHF